MSAESIDGQFNQITEGFKREEGLDFVLFASVDPRVEAAIKYLLDGETDGYIGAVEDYHTLSQMIAEEYGLTIPEAEHAFGLAEDRLTSGMEPGD